MIKLATYRKIDSELKNGRNLACKIFNVQLHNSASRSPFYEIRQSRSQTPSLGMLYSKWGKMKIKQETCSIVDQTPTLFQPGGELPYEEYMGMCHELGSHFQEKIPKRVYQFFAKIPERAIISVRNSR